MKKLQSCVLCILALGLALTFSPAASAVTDPGAESVSPSTDAAPVTLTPEQIEAMQEAAGIEEDKSVFEKASDFVTDNAPFFILGIIVIAAVLAGIFILHGRPGKPKPPKAAASPRAGTPQAAPSAAELRRRKRAAIQRSREEERLRRKAGIASRRAGVDPRTAAQPGAALDPIQAEKLGAQGQAAAVPTGPGGPGFVPGGPVGAARPTGAIAAPFAPTQNAPAPGVVIESPPVPDLADPAQAGYQSAPADDQTRIQPPAPEETRIQPPEPPPAAPQVPAAPTASTPVPPESPPSPVEHEPALEAPGLDATVGNAAAAFAAASAGGAIGARSATRGGEPTPVEEPEATTDRPTAEHGLPTADVAGAPAPVIDEQLQAKLDELKAGQGGPAFSPGEAARSLTPGSDRETDRAPAAPSPEPEELSPGLAAIERRLSAERQERERTLGEAEERLRRIEQRAEDAERRAAFAERLAQLKVEESERERRLQDVVSGIDRAEQRAREAEARAAAAEQTAAAALEQPVAPIADVPEGLGEKERPDREPEPPAREPERPAGSGDAPSEAPSRPSANEPEGDPVVSDAERKDLFTGSSRAPSAAGGTGVDLNSATFEELRGLDLSVTQATRVLAYRERFGGYREIDDLAKVPGFPPELIESLRSRFTV